MKKSVLIFFLIFGVVSTSNANTTVTYQTYNVPNSPFTITKKTIMTGTFCGRDCNNTTITYQYYLRVRPEPVHAGLQRIEYVGFRVVYQNTVRYFQLFPDGGIRELTDINQALFEPSNFVLNPGNIGQYQLFSQPIPSNLTGINSSVCLNNVNFFNLPNSGTIRAVNFMAGYGFLTQKDIDIINLQKSLHNDPVIQQQMIRAQTIDIQTMKWALAQGNMFQKKAYYNVYDLTNMCQNPNQQPGWTR